VSALDQRLGAVTKRLVIEHGLAVGGDMNARAGRLSCAP
jgi:hypothetical protein